MFHLLLILSFVMALRAVSARQPPSQWVGIASVGTRRLAAPGYFLIIWRLFAIHESRHEKIRRIALGKGISCIFLKIRGVGYWERGQPGALPFATPIY
jgi:hypothetical protein